MPLKQMGHGITELSVHVIYLLLKRQSRSSRRRINGFSHGILQSLSKGNGQSHAPKHDHDTDLEEFGYFLKQHWQLQTPQHFGRAKAIDGNNGKAVLDGEFQKSLVTRNHIFFVGMRARFGIAFKHFGNPARSQANSIAAGQSGVDGRATGVSVKMKRWKMPFFTIQRNVSLDADVFLRMDSIVPTTTVTRGSQTNRHTTTRNLHGAQPLEKGIDEWKKVGGRRHNGSKGPKSL